MQIEDAKDDRKGEKMMTLVSSSTEARESMEIMSLATGRYGSTGEGRDFREEAAREGHFISHIDISANSVSKPHGFSFSLAADSPIFMQSEEEFKAHLYITTSHTNPEAY